MASRSQAGLLRVDASGIITEADAEARRTLGDVEGRPVADVLGGDGTWVRAGDDLEAIRSDGRRVPVAVGLRPADDGTFRIEVRDVSSERRKQERLRASEAQLRQAQEVARIGSWVWDIERDQITWSDELYRIYGLEPQSFQATYDAYLERIHPDDKDMANEVVQKAFEDHGTFSFDHRIVRADGEVRLLHGQGAVDAADGKPVRMYGISQDVTEQRMAEELARRALEKEMEADHYKRLDKERARLLNTMAHELNTPITPLRLQVHMLREGILGELDDAQERALRVVDQNVGRLAVLLQDILDVARLQSSKLKLRKQDTDVSGLVADALETFRPQAENDAITLAAECPASAVMDVDADRMTQVLHNLLSNALKFTPEGGHITVRLETGEDGIRVEVEDDGAGMTEAQMRKLFRPFSQVHDDPDKPGTGLGLHICKGIIEEHGGKIECESDGPGKGCTFRVTVPGTVKVQQAA